MMKRYALVIALFLLPTTLFAQTQTPPCLIETPQQRAIWDRMKAENHVGYQQIVKNTTWERYNDIGRWEMLAAIVNRDQALGTKSILEIQNVLSNWTNIFAGNESREYAIELPVMYGCLYPYMTDEQRTNFYDYNVKVAEKILSMLRLGDSDQATGNILGLLLMDKVMGTSFGQRTFFNGITNQPVGGLTPTDCQIESSGRDAVCYFAKVMGEGGAWPEGTQYNGGTLWLWLSGIQWLGIENFPEALPFLRALPKYLMHEHMPGLRNRWEFGDTEHPNQMILAHGPQDIWQVLQSLLDEIGEPQLAAYVRQFEVDMLAANGIKTQNPLYARYYYRHNPYGQKLAWREWAGKSYAAVGQGLANWRTGWDCADKGTYLQTPGVTRGVVDHWNAFEFDIRHFRKCQTAVDHPLGYGADRRLFNTVLVRDSGMSIEVGGLTGTAYLENVVGYAGGYNAGVSQDVYEGYTPAPPTFQHGQFRHVFEPLDGPADAPSVLLVVDTIHAEDPTTLVGVGWQNSVLQPEQMYSKLILDRFKRAKPITFYWHTPVSPTIVDRKISWTLKDTKVSIQAVQATAPLLQEIVDESVTHCSATMTTPGCLGGYMAPSELKFQVRSSTETLPIYSTFVHCITATEVGSASCEALESSAGVHTIGGVVIRPNLPNVSFLASAVQGPKLVTSLLPNGRVRWDRSKAISLLANTRICDAFAFNAKGGDVYVADLCESKTWEVEQDKKLLPMTKVDALWKFTTAAGAVSVRPMGSVPPPPPPPPPCTYSVAPTTIDVVAAASSATIQYTASDSTCPAPAIKPSVAWITPGTAASAAVRRTLEASNDAVTIAVEQNTGPARSGDVIVDSVTVTVNQMAAPAPPPPPCVPRVEVGSISATASAAAVAKFVNDKEATGYEFIGWRSAGMALFRKVCR